MDFFKDANGIQIKTSQEVVTSEEIMEMYYSPFNQFPAVPKCSFYNYKNTCSL